jgi:accessory gene regulator B
MFDKLAFNAASWIKQQNPEQTASIPVLQFALTGLLNSLLVFVIVVFIGAVSGNLSDSLMASLFFVALHFVSGGHHFKSSYMCTLFSSSMIIFSFIFPLDHAWVYIFTVITIMIMVLFAPSNIEGHARIPKTYFPLLKIIAICIVLVNLLLLNSAVAFAMLFQAMLVIPFTKIRMTRR